MNRQSISSATHPERIIYCYYNKLNDNQKNRLAIDCAKNLISLGKHAFGHKKIDRPTWMKFMKVMLYPKHFNVKLIDGSMHTVFTANNRVYPLQEYIKEPWKEIIVPKEFIKEWRC